MSQPVRVLIVEDDALAASVIEHELKKAGMTVVAEAYDGMEAVRLTSEIRPDVVLMDIRMPKMDGLEAAALIQAKCPTPVVLLTAYDDPAFVERASQAGVGAYLLKPPDAREIERSIIVARARFADQQRLHQLTMELSAYDRSVSHDLRNVLGYLMMSTEMLAENGEEMEIEDRRLITQHMYAMAQRGLNVIDSLLWLSQPESTPVTILDMHQIVTDVCTVLQVLYGDRASSIALPPSLPVAIGHAGLVERVWDNFISNAIKYGGNPAYIELGGEATGNGQVRYWVRDHGDGIAPALQPQIFTPFFRAVQGATHGFGLGLPLAKRIVERLGGVCGVESSGRAGEGALFYFTLPAQSENREQAAP